MGEWLYYNFAAGSFHIKKLCSRLFLSKIEFYSKNKHHFLSHLLKICRSWCFLKEGGSIWAQISDGKGRRRSTNVSVRKLG